MRRISNKNMVSGEIFRKHAGEVRRFILDYIMLVQLLACLSYKIISKERNIVGYHNQSNNREKEEKWRREYIRRIYKKNHIGKIVITTVLVVIKEVKEMGKITISIFTVKAKQETIILIVINETSE